MNHHPTFLPLWSLLVASALLLPPPRAVRGDEDPAGVEEFERYIRPVLVEHCYECHSAEAETVEGEFRLDSREGLRQGGASGAAIVPGDPDGSLLLRALRYEDLQMPPDGPLDPAVVARFEAWIAHGAADPRDEPPSAAPTSGGGIDWEEARQFWAFQPPQRHPAPPVTRPDWVRQPIDRFVLARMEVQGLEPNEPAGRETLIRRVSFALIGLPPTPAQVDRFLQDRRPEAYEHLVDRLLASPRFGEHWARLWLDVARYAEDQAHIVGDDRSLFYPNAYLYRDWVIDAFNQDLPYDQFIRYQLAADRIAPDRTDLLPALGFLGLGPKYYGRRSLEVMADEWADRVDVVGRGLLGLTIACARCHDHKFDPIKTEDYYALAGVFASTEMFNRPLAEGSETRDNGQSKSPDDAMHIVRDGEVQDLPVYVRGDVHRPGEVEPRHFPRILCQGPPAPWTGGSGRRELAEAIADPDNPLTARVLVNRIWGELFGRALVATPSNFGSQGALPSHPELLDDLAVRFVESGWSIKGLIRELATSATYRQSSVAAEEKRRADPENVWLARMPQRRLKVEAWRDAMLQAAGVLDAAVGGESIEPDQADDGRRTVYSRISRLELNHMLALFDFPDPNNHAARRTVTTTPLQKLFLLNSPFLVAQADKVADRICREPGEATDAGRMEFAYRLLFSRSPTARERELGCRFVEQVRSREGEQRAWRTLAQALLATNEFYFVD